MSLDPMPRVFISYSRDSDRNLRAVAALADRLRRDGCDVRTDGDGDAASTELPRWMQRQIEEADFVLMVWTPAYARRFDDREQQGVGRGVAWEAHIIRQLLYEAGGVTNHKFIPLTLQDEPQPAISVVMRGYLRYSLSADYPALLARLHADGTRPDRPAGPRPPALTGGTGAIGAETVLGRRILDAADTEGWSLRDGAIDIEGVMVPLKLLTEWGERVRASDWYTHLPSLLGSDRRLPMASMYVELALCPTVADPSPLLLAARRSLAGELSERRARRRQRRIGSEVLLEHPSAWSVILGDPGSGKSSLVRRFALDVARGSASRWQIAMVLPLAQWWERCQHSGAVDLLRFGVEGLCAGSVSLGGLASVAPSDERLFGAIERLLVALAGPGREHVLVLCDGLDELAGTPDAMERATAQIRAIAARFGCIVTSRPAGFFGGLDEHERYTLLELEADGIETLVTQWFAHQDDAALAARDTSSLVAQLRDNPRLLEMARNPFLCTLLCLLQHGSSEALPAHRPAIYERVLQLAHEQARNRTHDPRCFDLAARASLSRFCKWLYTDAPSAPRHLFREDEWQQFEPDAPDFASRLLPARVVTRWSELGDYHLVHLTLHEYLVAKALTSETRSLADRQTLVARVFWPQWRVVLRFAGAIWWTAGQRDQFRELIDALITPPDILGRSYVDAAWILFDAGVRDTSVTLGFDLRERLWGVWAEGQSFIAEAAAEAIGLLDPEWTTRRIIAVTEGRFAIPERATGTQPDLDLLWLGDEERRQREGELRVLKLLAYVRHTDAEDLLLQIALGRSATDARMVAMDALASVDNRRIRQAVLAASERRCSPATVESICRYAEQTRCRELLPWLHARLRRLALRRPTPRADDAIPRDEWRPVHMSVLSALADIGDASSIPEALRWFRGVSRRSDEDELLHHAQSAVLTLGGIVAVDEGATTAASAALVSVIERLSEEQRAALGPEIVSARLCTDAELLGWLDDPERRDELLEAVGEVADAGYLLGPEVVSRLAALAADGIDEAYHALVRCLTLDVLMNRAPVDRTVVRAGLRSRRGSRRSAAAYALGMMEDVESLPRLIKLALSARQPWMVRTQATHALGLMKIPSGESLDALDVLVVDPDEAVAEMAAQSLCGLDIGRAARHRGLPHMRAALARRGATDDELMFESGYVDRHGRFVPWET